jgi:anaerobic selenocysteine-containing dehydrogenase
VVKIEGDHEHPLNRGALCPKGAAAMKILYHPQRLVRPLKREGRRGDGRWSAISWEEAFDVIARRLSEHRDSCGAKSVAFVRGAAKGLQDDYLARFANLFGSPNNASMAHVCFVPRKSASMMTYGFYAVPDIDHPPGTIVVWGNNITDTLLHVYLRIRQAKDRGAKLIVIDPVKNTIAREADLWIPLRPGTDLALVLAMLDVVVEERLYDREFVENFTVGFNRLTDHLSHYRPEAMSSITGVPPEIIREAARLYAGNGPACIQWGNGIDHSVDNFQTARSLCILRAITGNIGTPGGEVQWEAPPVVARWSPDVTMQENISQQERAQRVTGGASVLPILLYALPQAIVEAILTGKPYPIKACYLQGCNPLLTYPNAGKVREAFSSLDFLAVADLFMTPTASIADIVLPVTTYLENDSIVTAPYSLPVATVQQRVTRVAECRSDYEILRGLAVRLGFEDQFWEKEEECLEFILGPSGLSFEQFRKIGILAGKQQYGYHLENGFPTPSKKVEIYSERLANWGFDPLPGYSDLQSLAGPLTDQSTDFPYLMTSWKVAAYTHTGERQIEPLRKKNPEPIVYLHPGTARQHGVADGDMVTIETSTGRIYQKAKVTEDIREDTIGVDYGWWFPEDGRGSDFRWDTSNAGIIVDDKPPYSNELGTPRLRAVPCRICKKSSQRLKRDTAGN